MRLFLKMVFSVLLLTTYGCVSPLIKAAGDGDITTTQKLIEEGVDVNDPGGTDGESALIVASKNGQINIVKTLIQAGADVNLRTKNNDTALTAAAWKCHPDIIALLLANGADPNAQNTVYKSTPLSLLAAFCNSTVSTQALLLKGADTGLRNRCEDTALITAAENGYSEMVTILLDSGADVNETGALMQTALHRAVSNGHMKTIAILLARGAEVNREVNYRWCTGRFCLAPQLKWTALMIAAAHGHADAVDLLLDKGADPHALSNDNQNALIIAAKNGHARIVESLFKKGVNPNIVPDDANGHPALVSAVIRNYRTTVETLLKNGTDINIKTKDGKTALTLAKINGRNDMQKLLEEHGAKE